MIDAIRAWFAWREVRNTGVWSYQTNDMTGGRRIVRVSDGGYQPNDGQWVDTGEFVKPPNVFVPGNPAPYHPTDYCGPGS